jgi:quercetin 2,3-dioxygenase
MTTIRRSQARGFADHGWLKSHHTFSFADYHDPAHMGVGNLRVINEDRIAPGSGFGTHGHRDMEIVSVVIDGALAHKDSMGNGTVIKPGEVQRMSAGRGVMHSEFNHDPLNATHFFQIWILPSQQGVEPGYEQRLFDDASKRGKLVLVASEDGAQGSLRLHANARMYLGHFHGAEQQRLPLAPGRQAYVQVARGELRVNGERLSAGDGARVEAQPGADNALMLSDGDHAEVMVFDLE